MYEVNGFPSTRTSTRRWATFGSTSTLISCRGVGARGSRFGSPESRVPRPNPPITRSQDFVEFTYPRYSIAPTCRKMSAPAVARRGRDARLATQRRAAHHKFHAHDLAQCHRPARSAAPRRSAAGRRALGAARRGRAGWVRGAWYAGRRVGAPRPHAGPGRARGHHRRADSSPDGHAGGPRRGRSSVHRRVAGGVVPGRGAGAVRGRPGGSRPRLSGEHARPAARPARAVGSRGGTVLPHVQGPDARRLLHVRDRRHARAAPCPGPGPLRRVRPPRAGRPNVCGVTRDDLYDAIVVGSGITGGWAAKELCEKGLKTLVLERGRNVEPGKDYVTEWLQPWQLPHRGLGEQQLYERDYPIQSKNYAF